MSTHESDKDEFFLVLIFSDQPVLISADVEYDTAIAYRISSFEQGYDFIRVVEISLFVDFMPGFKRWFGIRVLRPKISKGTLGKYSHNKSVSNRIPKKGSIENL